MVSSSKISALLAPPVHVMHFNLAKEYKTRLIYNGHCLVEIFLIGIERMDDMRGADIEWHPEAVYGY